MKDYIQINKFSKFHNGNNIIFCKTDFLQQELEKIRKIQNDVVLITGNSDYPITENYFHNLPKNITKWYAQNALYKSDILEPIPIGIENRYPSLRDGHGIGYYDKVTEKEGLLSRNIKTNPSKFIYSNFTIGTNFLHRNECKNKSIETDFIDWEDSNLSFNSYFDKILDYKMVLCPIGNGVDTHRLWEVLYSNRIPITIKVGDYKIYELYKKLPIIILDNTLQLQDKELIQTKFHEIKNKNWDSDLLSCSFWENQILKSALKNKL
jgi:hypothetical protein